MKRAEYDGRYAELIVEYFNGYDSCAEGGDAEDGTVRGGRASRSRGRELPSFIGFARRIGVLLSDLERWRAEESDFACACAEAERYLRALVLSLVLCGEISPAAAKYYYDDGEAAEVSEGSFEIRLCFEGEARSNGESVGA